MKAKNKLLIIESIVYFISIVLIIKWYDWRLLLIITLFCWGNNLMIMRKNRWRKK